MSVSQHVSAGQHGSAPAHAYVQPGAANLARPTPTLGWAVRRALIGIVIMTVTVAGAACLLYFTIDPEAEARAEGDASRARPATAQIRQSL